MKNIAVIPARGGSKRIPHKNIIDFRGRPMIAWTIEAALCSGIFDTVLVSTDDEKIAQISELEGAEVPFLRNTKADDHSAASEATIASLIQYMDHFDTNFENVVQLMPNCPLRGVPEIVSAWEHFIIGKHNFQISAFEFGWMNPWWAARIKNNYQPDWIFPKALEVRSQDLDKLYCPTGAIWIAKVPQLIAEKTFYGNGLNLYPIEWQRAVDIDDWDDFKMCNALAHITELSE